VALSQKHFVVAIASFVAAEMSVFEGTDDMSMALVAGAMERQR
jgi:hypothetical protein